MFFTHTHTHPHTHTQTIITKNWNRIQINLNQVNILNWQHPHQFSPNSFRLVLRQTNKRWRREKVTTQGSQNLACLMRLYSGGQFTIAEAKLESSLCIEINRRFPFPLCYFNPSYNSPGVGGSPMFFKYVQNRTNAWPQVFKKYALNHLFVILFPDKITSWQVQPQLQLNWIFLSSFVLVRNIWFATLKVTFTVWNSLPEFFCLFVL